MTADRARSFGAVAAEYAEYRPGYPAAAVEWACHGVGGRLLDLGAGTGKLTAELLGRGEPIAVEPDPAMLAELRRRLPGVDAREGSAEAIPLPDASVDAVLIGQAWHWFDLDRALPELARVLRPGGVLAALWNADDRTVQWVLDLHRTAAWNRSVPGVARDGIPDEFAIHPAFRDRQHRSFANPTPTSTDRLLAAIGTHSWALLSEPADRDAALHRIRGYLDGRPETSSGEFVLPMTTEVLRALRR